MIKLASSGFLFWIFYEKMNCFAKSKVRFIEELYFFSSFLPYIIVSLSRFMCIWQLVLSQADNCFQKVSIMWHEKTKWRRLSSSLLQKVQVAVSDICILDNNVLEGKIRCSNLYWNQCNFVSLVTAKGILFITFLFRSSSFMFNSLHHLDK